MSLLYQPPAGYYDLPFIWVFDGSQLTDGANSLNNVVPIYAGYGDFILRRIVGLDNLLNSALGGGSAGSFQIRDALGAYLQSQPQSIGAFGFGEAPSDIAMSRDVYFKENSSIVFDLYNIARAVGYGSTYRAQIAFQGVRRLPGVSPWRSPFPFAPKSYTYTASFNLGIAGSVVYPQPCYTQIIDYDFELYAINILYTINAAYVLAPSGNNAAMTFYSQLGGAAGIGTEIVLQKTTTPNQPLVLAVAGNVITLTGATDAGGNTITVGQDILEAINGNPASAALVFVTNLFNPNGGYTPATLTLTGGGGGASFEQALIQLYDQNGVVCQSQPMVESYLNNVPGLIPTMGALVPPLLYKQNSVLRMDFTNYNNLQPTTASIQYIGRQRIPC